MAGSPHKNAWTTSIFCRMKKSPAWNRPCRPPTKAKPRMMNECDKTSTPTNLGHFFMAINIGTFLSTYLPMPSIEIVDYL